MSISSPNSNTTDDKPNTDFERSVFNPGVPFWAYAPLLLLSATLLLFVAKETLEK